MANRHERSTGCVRSVSLSIHVQEAQPLRQLSARCHRTFDWGRGWFAHGQRSADYRLDLHDHSFGIDD